MKKYQKATFNELVQKEEERSLLADLAEDPASEGEEVKEAADGFDEEVKEAADGFDKEVKEAADGFGEAVKEASSASASTSVPPWRVQPLPDPPSRSSKSKSSRVPPPADEHIESPASASNRPVSGPSAFNYGPDVNKMSQRVFDNGHLTSPIIISSNVPQNSNTSNSKL